HQSLDLVIQSNIVHVSGESGAGKTTMYDAIKWCVYGAKSIVAPRDQKSTIKTEVTIITNTFLIARSNNPRSIIYQDIQGTLIGEEAQVKINQLFGTHPIWMVE